MTIQGKIQLGKQGITQGFINSLENRFKTHDIVRISVLKSAGHDKEKVREMANEIIEKLGKKYTAKIIGFTIVVRKWRKARR